MRRPRLSYANVISSVALFAALGGTSYAALALPRGSVGPAQIRAGAVGSRQLRHHGISLADISSSARRSLRSAPGPVGPPGPAGVPAVSFFAVVGSAGQFLRGNASDGGHIANGSGSYTIGFARNVGGCAFTATLGSNDATSQPPGFITVRDDAGKVGVQIYDSTGRPADRPFHLIVAC